MARPRKQRRVRCMPSNMHYGPTSCDGKSEKVIMTVDEFETIRLIDFENKSQEECAEMMNVGRSTVQGIYKDARFKVASALVNGHLLMIDGGDFTLHEDGCEQQMKRECCGKKEERRECCGKKKVCAVDNNV